MSEIVTKSGLECLEIVLKKCIAKNDDWIKKLTTIFESCKIITADTSKEVCQQLGQTEHNHDDIIDIITKSIETGVVKRKRFEEAGKAKDFPGGSLVSNAVEYFGFAAFISEWIKWLVISWDDIERPEVQELVIADWPNCKWDKELWVLQFIMKCAKDKQLDKVELMTEKIKSLLQELQGNQMSMNPDQDDDLSSFVNIEESEVQESWKNVEQATAQALAENETHLEVIESILKEYFIMESENVMTLFSLFKDVGLITAENSFLAMKNTEEQRFFASHLMEMVMTDNSFKWKDKIIVACERGEFPGDKAFASIIKTLLKRKVIRDEIQWFISAWNQVKKSTILIEGIIADTWKEEFKMLTENNSWPLYLYETCILSEDKAVVKDFIDKVAEVLQKASTSTEGEHIDADGDVIMKEVSKQSLEFSNTENKEKQVKTVDDQESSKMGEEEERDGSAGQEETSTSSCDEDDAENIQASAMQYDVQVEPLADVVPAEVSLDDPLTSLEKNKDWLNDSLDIIESSYDLIKPIAELTWPSNEEITDQENWPFSLISKWDIEEDASTLDSFVSDVKRALMPGDSDASLREEYDDSIKWLNNSLSLLIGNKESFQPLANSYWPELESEKSLWPTSLLSNCSNETDQKKVIKFVSEVKDIFIEKEYKESISWLRKSMKFLNSEPKIKSLIQSIWLDTIDLAQKRWQTTFITECKSGKDKKKVNAFVRKAEEMMKAKPDDYDASVKEEYDDSIEWLNNSLPLLIANKESFQPLANSYWPELESEKSLWPTSLLSNCSNETDQKKVIKFVSEVKDIFIEKEYKESISWLRESMKFLNSEPKIKSLIQSIWLDTIDLTQKQWQTTFIKECKSGKDKENVNEFVRKAKEMMKAKVQSDNVPDKGAVFSEPPQTYTEMVSLPGSDSNTMQDEKQTSQQKPGVDHSIQASHDGHMKPISSVKLTGSENPGKNYKEMKEIKEWIQKSRLQIEGSIDNILKIAWGIWSEHKSITTATKLIEMVLNETSSIKVNQFVSRTQEILNELKETEKDQVAMRTRQKDRTADSQIKKNKEWVESMKNSLKEYGNVAKRIAIKIWPEDDQEIITDWPNKLIWKCQKETDGEKLQGFVKQVEAELSKVPELQKQERNQHTAEISIDDNQGSSVDQNRTGEKDNTTNQFDDDIAWLKKSIQVLTDYGEGMRHLLVHEWPDKPEISNDPIWPFKLIEECINTDDKPFTLELIKRIKNYIELAKCQVDKGFKQMREPGKNQVEFRAVHSHSHFWGRSVDVSPLWITTSFLDWKPLQMTWDDKQKIYCLVLPFAGNLEDFEYKYRSISGDEELTCHTSVNEYRMYNNQDGCTGRITLFDVVKFPGQHLKLKKMVRYLPDFHKYNEIETDLSLILDDIYSWVFWMKHGWRTSHGHITSDNTMLENILKKWVTNKLLSGLKKKVFIPCIVCCLALCNALIYSRYTLKDQDLLCNLFEVLSMENLTEGMQKKLYKEILCHFISNEMRSAVYTVSIPDTLLGLFMLTEKLLVSEFIFVLPLYWLVFNGGELVKKLPQANANNNAWLFPSCLPAFEKVEWKKIKASFQENHLQKNLLALESHLLKFTALHPWIGKAFQYMLSYQSIMDMISKKSELVFFFDLESILQSLQSQGMHKFSKVWPFVEQVFDKVTKMIASRMEERMQEVNIQGMMLQIKKILEGMKTGRHRSDEDQDVLYCLKIANKILNVSAALNGVGLPSNIDTNGINEIAGLVFKRLDQSTAEQDSIQHWNDLLNMQWSDGEVGQIWFKDLSEKLQVVIDSKWLSKDEGFMNCYCQITMKLHAKLDSLFEARAEKAFENMLRQSSDKQQTWNIFSWISARVKPGAQKKINRLYDRFVSKQLKNYTCPLHFMLHWPHLMPFFRLFYESRFSQFSTRTKKIIQNHIINFNKVIKELLTGKVMVKDLEMLFEFRQRCIEICGYTDEKLLKRVNIFLDFRFEQRKAYYETKGALSVFLQSCKYLEEERVTVDVYELDEMYGQDIKELQFSELVQCSDDPHNRTVKVIFYDQVVENMNQVLGMGFLENNSFFLHIWKSYAKEMKKKWLKETVETDEGYLMVTWERILKELWIPVENNLFLLVGKIDKGTISISKLFERLTDLSDEEICKEIRQLYDFYNYDTKPALNNCQKRIVDAQNIMEVKKSCAINDILLDIVDVLKLEGKFQSLKIFSSKEQKEISLLMFSKEHHSRTTVKFNSYEVNILKSFVEEDELIIWLRKKTKEVKDIQALCDLAMINAGDNPMEVDRVSTLLSAVMGFSPLLFGVEDIKDINTLNKRCKEVISNCNKDPKLQSKWKSTGSVVEWITQIEDFYGKDHIHAMREAEIINTSGVYIITCKVKNNPVLVDCIELRLKKLIRQGSVNEADQKKSVSDRNIYKLADLHDLQSKLMLIAGEREDRNHVTTYVNLLTAVESLTQVFVQLVSAGCMLFENWKMEIASNVDSDFIISVRFDEEAPPISGTGKMETIDSITSVMNTIFSRWTRQMNKYRLCHYYLNEFNVQQITYLCKELADIHIASVPDQVYMLLARVKKNTTLVEITQALNEATISTDDDDDDTSIEENRENLDDDSQSEEQRIEKMKRMVRTLVREDDVPEEVAKAAVMERGVKDKDDCSDWILLNFNETDEVNELAEKFNQAIGFAHEEGIVGAVATVLHDRSTRSLREVMIRLQQEASSGSQAISASLLTVYEKYNMDTAALTLRDFLSVKHLGKFLTILGQPRRDLNQSGNIDQPRSSPQREMKPPLQSGKPNLIICQERDLLMQVLSLYMHSKDQPLPTTSEVLICSEKTNADEVERFFRRALCNCDNDRNPLFCLAMAHKLSHNVSEAAERIFTALSQSDINREFKLVIFTSKQQHYLTTCFDQYHVDMRYQVKEAETTEYLAKHLKVNMNVWKKSAACVEANYQLVKVVYSYRSGVGKTLHVKRLKKDLQSKMESHTNASWHTTTIRFMEKTLNTDHVIDMLNPTDKDALNADTHLIHLDFTPAVREGVEEFAFNLLILGSIEDSQGRIWQRHQNHMYAVEITEFVQGKLNQSWNQHILEYLPKIRCLSPKEVVENGNFDNCLPMDQIELESETIQRPFQYLLRHYKKEDLDDFKYNNEELNRNQKQCINIFLKKCSIKNPSWAQLHHFASFLNIQLANCEKSIFCNKEIVGELIGLKSFAVSFMIKMAQDFATPSLSSTDESIQDVSEEEKEYDQQSLSSTDENIKDVSEEEKEYDQQSLSSTDENIQDVSEEEKEYDQHQLRRKWEESSHPYIFFNDDGISMSFINVNITEEGHLVDRNKEVITHNAISQQLLVNLIAQGVPLGVNFDSLNRAQKLMEICKVMGINCTQAEVPDPDPTYELTTDNVLKILAIYMRFKCQIPVIIMGETGCGKTRMVEFISRLKVQNSASGVGAGKVKNIITLKVHGGVTVKDVHQSIERAKEIAQDNMQEYGLNTILFFDEANTTESIYAIKEVVCDLEVNGKSFQDSELQIVAACNPYKKLSDNAIKKLENSGLGYRVKKEDTKDKLGSIPMRTLVYRVVALPPSMQPFVWDFGQLADDTEKIYIEQMIKKLGMRLGLKSRNCELLSDMLPDVQCYMRKQKDETRYVSLRDVERCMIAFEWFWKNKSWLYCKVKDEHKPGTRCYKMDEEIRTLIQVLGVCYHASLDDRKKFRKEVSERLNIRLARQLRYEQHEIRDEIVACQRVLVKDMKIRLARQLRYEQHEIRDEIVACQRVLVKDMKIEKDIALNEALVENVFMIAICADMKIPLFLVGKPGSSKSLAKTIVSDNMRGPNSTSEMFKHLKQVQVVSFQCSALTHASGIESVFNQCVRLQENQDVTKYSAVVVLDEIGLAEDSPNMPLKVLHPLLESGSTKSESLINTDPNQKVAFVGISNWSLDPAKMNRGLFVTRKKPSEKDLRITTQGIFSDRKDSEAALRKYNDVIKALTSTYLKIYKSEKREYFGLRDFYSLMKMVRPHCMGDLTMQDVMTAVQRNFSGGKVSHIEKFEAALESKFEDIDYSLSSVQDIIEDNLRTGNESRYLLLLTNQYSAINLLHLMRKGKNENVQVIFGSSFPGDKNYTEICRNINRIKICMQAGSPVVILNLTEIHESLYDALNQHYVTFGDQKYVDLGLGGHRVKSRVHNDFKMIIVEKKDIVYEEYPIPLINRLEKLHFDSKSLLMHKQKDSAKDVERWVDRFTAYDKEKFEKNEDFLGFHDDTVSSIILVCDEKRENCEVEHYQQALLQSATMDAVFRLPKSNLIKKGYDVRALQEIYLNKQSHDSLIQLLKNAQKLNQESIPIYEVTTYSNILSEKDRTEVEEQLGFNKNSVMLLSLQQFETEQQFLRKLDDFFKKCQKAPADSAVLLIQCFQAHLYGQLISCARYALTNKLTQFIDKKTNEEQKVTVVFLLSTDRQSKNDGNEPLVLQHTTDGEIVYIDELRPTMKLIGPASRFFDLTLQEVFKKSLDYLTVSTSADEFYDIVSLLKDCVCEAIDKLQLETGERNLERIEILNRLFDHKENEFSAAVVKKITEILSQREEALEHVNHKLWMIEEAFSRKHLLEGGTFRKTIWLCLKHHTAQYLAYITSIIDSNNNLDVYSKSKHEAWERKMWLAVFEKYSIPWDLQCERELKVAYSLPQGSYQFQVPFMSMIFKELRDKWKATCEEFHEKEVTAIFLNTVRTWPLYSLIKEALNTGGEQMEDAFISDLVRMVYCSDVDPKPENEVQAIDKIVNYFVKSKCLDAKKEEYYQPGDELAVVFLNVIELQIYLKTLSDIFKTCPELIKNTDKWISVKQHPAYFEIHEHAFTDMMALIRGRSVEIKDATICREWIELARKAKKVFRDHIKRISDENKKKIIENWKPISFLYYFLTQILPSMSDEKLQKKYTQVIAKQANMLSKGCKQRDLQSKEYLRLLCGTIGKCYEEIKLKLIVCWQDSECKICRRRMQSPRRLPCGHFLCVNCARTISAAESSKCPTCAERIPKDVLREAVLTDKSAAQLSEFKSNCTSFFLRYLMKFTFAQKNISDVDIPALLIKELLLITDDKTDGKQVLKTFALDINVNFRSLILGKILQKGAFLEDINVALSNNNFDMTNAALKHYEWEKLDSNNQAESELVSRKWNEDEMQQDFIRLCGFEELSLDLFETIARIRLGIKAMSCYIHDVMKEDYRDEEDENKQERIESMVQFLCQSDDDTLKLYFIKCGCIQFGTDWFDKLTKTCLQLIPPYLAADNSAINYWMLIGKNFVVEKSRLFLLLPSLKLYGFKKELSCLTEFSHIEELVGALVTISWLMEQNGLKTAASVLRDLSQSDNSLPDLVASTSELVSSLRDFDERDKKILLELLTIVAIVISKQEYLVKDFFHILEQPLTLNLKFLPAMPESVYFTIPAEYRAIKKNVLGENWSDLYFCPNGHVYTIADCTHPMTLGKCVECGARIGGGNYRAAPGNKRFEFDEMTQAGYMLEDVNPPIRNMDKPEDRMSKQGVAVTQAILHSTMILALCKNPKLVSSFSKTGMNSVKFKENLIQKLFGNLQELSTSLVKNMDETLIIMHKILLNMIRTEAPENDLSQEKYDWSSPESRKLWEKLFRLHYLLPVFQNVYGEIADGMKMFSQAEEFCSNAIHRVMHDLPLENLQQKDAVWNNQDLWKTIVHPTSAHLLQTIQDKPNEQSAILQLVLNFPNLSLLHHLIPVIMLQKQLIEKNQYKLDMNKADKTTFQQYLQESGEYKPKLEEDFQKYFKAWRLVYPLLVATLQDPPHFDLCLNMNSSISLALPSHRGHGQLAKKLVEQLIDIQNEFLSECAKKIPGLRLGEVEVSDIHPSHLAYIDKQKDLLPLIRMHTNYHIVCDETGTQHQISYNISALEKRVREKFILYKKRLNKMSIPCIQYPQDIGIGTYWQKVKKNIAQVPLDQKLVANIEMTVQRLKQADLYEGVRTLTHAISFLSKVVPADHERCLRDYMVKDLMLSAGSISVIPRNAHIKHALALYQRLSWHKSKQFVMQGLNPYQEYFPRDQQKNIPDDLPIKLERAFAETKVSLLQQRLNEILIKKPDYSGDWSLVKKIFPYIGDYIDHNPEDDSWYKRLPEELCFKHIVHLFQLSVEYERDNK